MCPGVSGRRNDFFHARERGVALMKYVSLTSAKYSKIEIWKYLQLYAKSIDLMGSPIIGHAGQQQRAAFL
jgi:hypothetical protein